MCVYEYIQFIFSQDPRAIVELKQESIYIKSKSTNYKAKYIFLLAILHVKKMFFIPLILLNQASFQIKIFINLKKNLVPIRLQYFFHFILLIVISARSY